MTCSDQDPASQSEFTIPYRRRACDDGSDLVGLDSITILYRPSDLGRNLPCRTFTSLRRREGDITHSTDTMCYVML